MVQTEVVPVKSVFDVRRGDIWQLGEHRLMCGDAQSATDVAVLFGGAKADLVVTSPHYLNRRDYTAKIPCWDTLMLQVFTTVPSNLRTQMLINLGIIHQNNECHFYWWNWLQQMRDKGWKHYSLYVWDKKQGACGLFSGRLRPSYEFVFHLNKRTINANAWQPTLGKKSDRSIRQTARKRDGSFFVTKKEKKTAATKVPDNVIRHGKVSSYESVGHPAQYPASFASYLIRTWGQAGDAVYDPFCGSGSTILAAKNDGRIGYGMEIAPEYVEMALKRWLKMHPDQMPVLIDRTV